MWYLLPQSIAIQLNWMSATLTTEGFVRVGNDAFYHARRMIDAAADLGSFYQFDPRIHARKGASLSGRGDTVWDGVAIKAGRGVGLADKAMKFVASYPSALRSSCR